MILANQAKMGRILVPVLKDNAPILKEMLTDEGYRVRLSKHNSKNQNFVIYEVTNKSSNYDSIQLIIEKAKKLYAS
ncbi:hypothetical protein BHU72_14550 [Desulfuribacillus stibiiarsenatis]|uniref:Uncharacterized protein n=1 Tax=Desulfuribacillus stibiiarsenatis TaxID=1390249 RepID=A0A1E5L7L9_9FIRM|nr:hypothetical protein [Desulfuribacillus stibiiarsenatis]OEH86048.1 hypothetical protein BHU72_14550 [Desulfuribacillus stibiiarsenatis]